LRKMNLTANPFEDFELFEETLDKETMKEHGLLFKDRKEITQQLLLGITTSSSYKAVLNGEAGVGKSSLLNKVLHDLREEGYFAVKYRVNEASAANPKTFERELLRAFGEEIPREALRNKGFLARLKSIVQMETRGDLRQLSILAVLYSSDQLTIREGKMEATGLSVTVGVPFLNAAVSDQEQMQIEVARVETLSHPVFVRLLRDGVSLLKELDYKGVVIAIDEIDKLEEKLEERILTLVKDTFYPTGLCHILLVMMTRNGRKQIHPDIFRYLTVHPLPKPQVLEFLQELYKSKAIDKGQKLSTLISASLIDERYEEKRGIIRPILIDLSACMIRAMVTGKNFIDRKLYEKTKATDAIEDYLRALEPAETEYKILSYLLRKGETYARDEDLSKIIERGKSAQSQKLHALQARGILISKKRKRNRIFSIDPSLQARVKARVT
jgi:GTPase SAR1 family protein